MDTRRATLAIIVFIVLLVLSWLFLAQGLLSLDMFRGARPEPAERADDTLTIYHSVLGEEHFYRGTIDLPTPCHTLTSSVTVSGGKSRAALIALRIEEPPQGAACAQTLDPQQFKVSLSSREVPTVTLTFNGTERGITVADE